MLTTVSFLYLALRFISSVSFGCVGQSSITCRFHILQALLQPFAIHGAYGACSICYPWAYSVRSIKSYSIILVIASYNNTMLMLMTGVCCCLMIIGVSLREPHIDHDNCPVCKIMVCTCIYMYMYVSFIPRLSHPGS